MAYNTSKMLTDSEGNKIAQIYDPATDSYVPLTTDIYRDVDVTNFPSNQSVSDASAHTRLDTLEASQQQILAKLDAIGGTVGVDNFPATQQVEVTGSLGKNLLYRTHDASLAPQDVITLLDTTNPTIIDNLEWYPRHETDAIIRIRMYGATGAPNTIRTIDQNGTGTQVLLHPWIIKTNGHPWWDIVRYDPDASGAPIFKFNLRNPLTCPFGLVITLENAQATGGLTFRNTVVLTGREM